MTNQHPFQSKKSKERVPMRIRYNNLNSLANDAVALNDVMSRFFNNVAYEYSRNVGSNGESGVSDTTPVAERETILPLDVLVTPEAFQVSAYLPGINPEDVEITFEGEE